MKMISNLRMKINNHQRWIAGALFLALTVGVWAGFEHLVPKVPGGLSSGQTRLGWYLHSGQWHADARTVAAVAHYVFSPDNQVLPTEMPATNNQVVDASLPSSPAAGATRTHHGDPS